MSSTVVNAEAESPWDGRSKCRVFAFSCCKSFFWIQLSSSLKYGSSQWEKSRSRRGTASFAWKFLWSWQWETWTRSGPGQRSNLWSEQLLHLWADKKWVVDSRSWCLIPVFPSSWRLIQGAEMKARTNCKVTRKFYTKVKQSHGSKLRFPEEDKHSRPMASSVRQAWEKTYRDTWKLMSRGLDLCNDGG